ncbi:MAG: hypothetical protein K2Q23_18185 [Bryobacteraceae bacterium]|nr:hypothetical protein [Bryobacteraceae bacterium]
MFRWLTNWYIDRQVAKERANLPVVDVRSLLERISEENHLAPEARYFLETRDQRFISLNPPHMTSEGVETVSLIVTWSRDGIPAWETEQPAKNLAERLARHRDLEAVLLLRRSLDSFVGYYVRVRPKPQ